MCYVPQQENQIIFQTEGETNKVSNNQNKTGGFLGEVLKDTHGVVH
jgi:hypothetical protein